MEKNMQKGKGNLEPVTQLELSVTRIILPKFEHEHTHAHKQYHFES